MKSYLGEFDVEIKNTPYAKYTPNLKLMENIINNGF